MVAAGLSLENVSQRPAEPERGFGSNRFDVGDAAHAVGAKESVSHDYVSIRFRPLLPGRS